MKSVFSPHSLHMSLVFISKKVIFLICNFKQEKKMHTLKKSLQFTKKQRLGLIVLQDTNNHLVNLQNYINLDQFQKMSKL